LVEEITETITHSLSATETPLFQSVAAEELLYFGVTEEALAAVQSVTSVSELAGLQPQIGVAAYEALVLLADGFTVDDVKQDLDLRRASKVNTEDFSASLETDESRSAFYIADNEDELKAVLNSPLAQWRIFLHPKQRRLATSDANGPMRVLGGAGTGKTVLAMHRAKWLAENRTEPGHKVLFTTFTRNLAADIAGNLESLCSSTTLAKIEVTNLDRWVKGYLSSKRYEHRIQYDISGEAEAAWNKAMAVRDSSLGLDEEFYKAEWEQVIGANGISTLDDYRTARRTGRKGILQRKTRDAIWPVFEEFRAQLTARKLKMVDDAYRDAAALLTSEPLTASYSAIVVDETQDFGPMALRLLRALIPSQKNDLFFVGDGHQRIYKRHRAAMSKCGIQIVGRSRKLNLNYRTTDEIRRVATALLDGYPIDDLDEGTDSSKGYTSLSHGPEPDLLQTDNPDRAVELAVQGVKAWRDNPENALLTQCVIVPKTNTRDDIAAALAREEIPTLVIDANNRDKGDPGPIRLATMHRAKGLEFDSVTVLATKTMLDSQEAEETDRKMLYVALTRAKREARLITF
jgi:superfamily I DNA/RNA helicase